MDYFIMCIGNREGGDDSVGPYVAGKLSDKQHNNIFIIDCGTTPENYTSIIKKNRPKNLIIVDAVEMNLKPGDIRIVPKEKIGVMTISTHGIPISVLIRYLEQHVENIFFIGIQPKTMSGKLTDIVKNSADKLVEIIKNNNLCQIETL